jgi:hypothetical protein
MLILWSGWRPLIGVYLASLAILFYGLAANWHGVGRRIQSERGRGRIDWPTFQFIFRGGAATALAGLVFVAVGAH